MRSASAARAGARPLGTFRIDQPVGDVVTDGHVREERVVLEHRVDVALVGRQLRDVPAVEQDAPDRSAARSPAIIRSVVVLPEPDGPSSEKNSPRPMSRSMPARP